MTGLEQYYALRLFEKNPDWADVFVDTGGLGLCQEVTEELVELCPELTPVFGVVRTTREQALLEDPTDAGRDWPHWWCVTASGEIVDLTRGQFAMLEPLTYHTWSGEAPTGKCLHCGCFTRQGSSFCSNDCAEEFASWSG